MKIVDALFSDGLDEPRTPHEDRHYVFQGFLRGIPSHKTYARYNHPRSNYLMQIVLN